MLSRESALGGVVVLFDGFFFVFRCFGSFSQSTRSVGYSVSLENIDLKKKSISVNE